MKRTEEEIDNILNDISDAKDAGTANRWPGMSYEDGVENALLWVTGRSDDHPYEEE